jgi:hypothetical protein
MIIDYEAAGFFPVGTGHAPLDEQTPTPEADEVAVFCDFCEDSSAFTDLFLGSVEVHLDHEDLRLQP